jgi:alanine racemase
MLAHRQPMIASVRRDAWVEVDLNAIERNIAVIRSWLNPGIKLMAVVKSDGYGHGAAGVAEVAEACGADWLGVASLDEGCQLRQAGSNLPILLLSPCPAWAVSEALAARLTLTVTSPSQIKDILAACRRQKRKASLHLKIDTGMHRLGVDPEKTDEILSLISGQPALELTGVCSHLARAADKDFSQHQNQVFERALARVKAAGHNPALIHLASGEAARRYAWTHYDMVRVGLYMYGLEPARVSDVVEPAMSVKGRINQIQDIEACQSVGYDLTWTSQTRTRLACVPIGYADGIDRRLSGKIRGLLMGKEIKQVGLLSMDQMLFDIGNVPEAQEGDVITLVGCEPGRSGGSQLYLADWAVMLDTITYELACRLRARMPRMYTRNQPAARSK